MNARLLVAGACALFGCAACGFKGPLYLPQQNAAVVTHPAPASAVKPSSQDAAHKTQKTPSAAPANPPGP